MKQYANGANVLHLSPDRIGEYSVVVPPSDLLIRYSRIVDGTFALVDVLENEIANLRATRDLLLPRLMSGQLTLRDAEEAISTPL